MKERNRFLLEHYILDAWHVTDDLNTVAEYIGDNPDIPAAEKDKLLNMLMGMHELYHIKFEKLNDLFGELIRNGTIDDRNKRTNL